MGIGESRLFHLEGHSGRPVITDERSIRLVCNTSVDLCKGTALLSAGRARSSRDVVRHPSARRWVWWRRDVLLLRCGGGGGALALTAFLSGTAAKRVLSRSFDLTTYLTLMGRRAQDLEVAEVDDGGIDVVGVFGARQSAGYALLLFRLRLWAATDLDVEGALVGAAALREVWEGASDGRCVDDKIVGDLSAAVPAAIFLRRVADLGEFLGEVVVHLTRRHDGLVLGVEVDGRVVADGAVLRAGRGRAGVLVSVEISSHLADQSRVVSRVG